MAAILCSAVCRSCRAFWICRRMLSWSSKCAARWRSRRAISLSRPAFWISRLSPDAIALASANWLAWLSGVFERADAAVAGERRGDEPRLALVGLPHRGVHRAQCGVGVDFDLVVLIALPLDAPFALLDLRRQPGHVEMVQRLQAQLHVDAGAHRVGRADQDAHAAGVELVEQALLVGRALEVLHEGDLARPGCRAARVPA